MSDTAQSASESYFETLKKDIWKTSSKNPICPKTGRDIIYDEHTGEALDSKTLIPIDKYVDFTNIKI